MAFFGLFKNKKQEEPALKVEVQPVLSETTCSENPDKNAKEIDDIFDDNTDFNEDDDECDNNDMHADNEEDDDYEEDVDDSADPEEAEALFQEAMDLYREGGRDDDYEAAFERMREAALKGHVKAMFYVGLMYKFGTGTDEEGPNEYAAADWFSTAALRDHRESQYMLATHYMKECNGNSIYSDYQRAMKWYARAAAQGHPDAKAALKKYNNH